MIRDDIRVPNNVMEMEMCVQRQVLFFEKEKFQRNSEALRFADVKGQPLFPLVSA